MSYHGEFPRTIKMTADVGNSTITMQPISEFTITLPVGDYALEFVPLYNVSATNVGTGWNLQGGTAVLSNYSFMSELSSVATAAYHNFYTSRNQDFATVQTSRTLDNRGVIRFNFTVTTAGTVIPHFRSEAAGALVTLRAGSYIIINKI